MPVIKGRLREADYTSVQINYVFLTRELDGQFLVDDMFAKKIFTFDDKEEIQNQDSRQKRTDKFLEKLLHSGPQQAYDVFLQALEEHYPHVAEKLKESVVENGAAETTAETPDDKQTTDRQEEWQTSGTYVKPPQLWPTFKGESLPRCKKDPDHKTFIPVKDFDIQHLPPHFQHPELVDCVKVLAEQTVLPMVRHASTARPAGYVFNQNMYRQLLRHSSGRVWRVMRKFSDKDDDCCPCEDCKQSPTPARQWGQFIVVTAKHVVFDDEECVNTKFILWYDEPEPTQDYPALTGVRMISSDIANDYCEVVSITHDKDVSEKLEAICHKNTDLSTKLAETCYKRQGKEKLTIIISHPHGVSKHVSVGEWVEGDNDRSGGPNKHWYTTATCPGSAGAPVLLLDERMSCCTTHSGGRRHGKNESGGKLWPL